MRVTPRPWALAHEDSGEDLRELVAAQPAPQPQKQACVLLSGPLAASSRSAAFAAGAAAAIAATLALALALAAAGILRRPLRPVREPGVDAARSRSPFPFPRIMHQMHASRDALSRADRRLSERCRRINPDFEYVFWDDDAVDALVRAEFAADYDWWRAMEPTIKRVDTSRYFILYARGGAYLDLDVECISPIESVVRDLPPGTAWLGGFPEPFQLMADVRHAFWPFFIRRIRNTAADSDAWRTTGPVGLNEAAKAYVKQHGDEVMIPFISNRVDKPWLRFAGDSNMTIPWYVRPFKMANWTRASGNGTGLGFFPNQVVDPGACKASRHCWLDTCARRWPTALYAHHCRGTWRRKKRSWPWHVF